MKPRKDVEQMNRFELMNEVERLYDEVEKLRNGEEPIQLRTQINWLSGELRVVRERMLGMEKQLGYMKDQIPRRIGDRRKQLQGRRKTTNRRKT